MAKQQFIFNGRRYIAPSKKEAVDFVDFWDGWFSKIHPLRTTWKIEHVELAPGWAQLMSIDEDNKVEYA